MPTAGVIGTGLIGGSIAAGLANAGWDVTGYDPDPDALRVASARGLVQRTADSVEALVSAQPDILIVAAPPTATIEILASLRTDLVVMDVAGVKARVMEGAAHLPNFVGTHPMAGRETSGPGSASAALFRGANWIVVEGGQADAEMKAVEVVTVLGANPVWLTAVTHDRVIASVSHLPQLIASGLVASASNTPHALDLAAGSFRDLTRVASSQPMAWVEILKANREAVREAISALNEQISIIEEAINSDDDDLLANLSRAKDVRDSLGAPVARVRVSLADEPGEIARVGHALEDSEVDVRDIQMRHAPHGGGGVLTLSVRAGEQEALRHALEAVGLRTVT